MPRRSRPKVGEHLAKRADPRAGEIADKSPMELDLLLTVGLTVVVIVAIRLISSRFHR